MTARLPVTLNRYIIWRAIAQALGLPQRSEAMPTTTVCPLCGKDDLTVYKDTMSGGLWHYCFNCESCGDMIELASKTWKLTTRQAIMRLSKKCVAFHSEDAITEEKLALYEKCHVRRRERQHHFWLGAKKFLALKGSKRLAALRDKFCIKGQLSTERWLNGPGQFIGGAHVRVAEQVFCKRGNKGARRLFTGRHWDDVLVLPFFAAPKLFSGWLFVGRDGSEKNQIFRSAVHAANLHSTFNESGLFGLETVEMSNRTFDQYVFAVQDPLLAMRMQVRNYNVSNTPLPIVSWYDKDKFCTIHSWSSLPRRQVIFWGFHMTASLLRQAMLCDGYISIVPLLEVTKHHMEHYIRLAPPRDLFMRAVRRAVPWKQALKSWVAQNGIGSAEELLVSLEKRYSVDIRELAVDLGYHIEDLLDAPAVRTLQLPNRKVIIDRKDGWYVWRSPGNAQFLVSSARFYVQQIISDGVNEPLYRGIILFEGHTLSFECPFSKLEKNTSSFIIAECVKAGLGRPRIKPIGVNLMEIAIGFRKPTVINIMEN